MSKKIKPMRMTGSNFNRNEKFNLSNVPKHFESITDEEIKRIKKLVMDEVAKVSQFKPGTLSDILKSVDGHFDSAYSTLEGDYDARLGNLDDAYTSGLTKLRYACDDFKLQVTGYNIALEKFSEASKVINGKEMPKNLEFDDNTILEIEQMIRRLDKRSKK